MEVMERVCSDRTAERILATIGIGPKAKKKKKLKQLPPMEHDAKQAVLHRRASHVRKTRSRSNCPMIAQRPKAVRPAHALGLALCRRGRRRRRSVRLEGLPPS